MQAAVAACAMAMTTIGGGGGGGVGRCVCFACATRLARPVPGDDLAAGRLSCMRRARARALWLDTVYQCASNLLRAHSCMLFFVCVCGM